VAVPCENGNTFWRSIDKFPYVSSNNRLHQNMLVTLVVINSLEVLTSAELKID